MIYETIKTALIEQLGIEADMIDKSKLLEKDLELDSTESVIIALEIKKKFSVDYVFPKHDITIGDICSAVENQIQQHDVA